MSYGNIYIFSGEWNKKKIDTTLIQHKSVYKLYGIQILSTITQIKNLYIGKNDKEIGEEQQRVDSRSRMNWSND